MDIPASKQMDADENESRRYPGKQEDYVQNGISKPGGAGDECASEIFTVNYYNLSKTPFKATINGGKLVDDICNPSQKPTVKGYKMADGLCSPPTDSHENGSCGYASKEENCEQNRVAEAGGAVDDCINAAHANTDTILCNTLSKITLDGRNIVDDLDNPHANPKMDADENGPPAHPSMLRTCQQRGVVNPGEAGDDCTSAIFTGNHNNFGKLSSEPIINEDELVDDICNSPANPHVNADEIVSCGHPSKQENCEQSKVVKPGKAGDDCSRGTHTSSNNNQNICNSVFKSNVLGYPYKRVDDFIFSDKSLVGRFTRVMRPSVQDLSQWSHVNWLPKLKSIWMFKILVNGFFKIEFFCHEDCEFVLENGPWFMGAAGLSLKRWSQNFDPQNPGPLKTPVWMTLLDLPLEFWNEDLLIKICSKVGKVLQIAESTTEMNGQTSAARVCVEVDLKEGLMASVDLQCKGASWTQDLDYEGIPFRCKICRSADHLDGSCLKTSAKNHTSMPAGFNPLNDDTSMFPVWVRLPRLPLEYWNEKIFMLIANSFGQYINADADSDTKFRKHFIFARFCVLVEKNKKLPSQVILSSSYGDWVQQIEIEESPVVCHCCCRVGHGIASCPSNL